MWQIYNMYNRYMIDILFRQATMLIKVCVVLVFGLQTPSLIDFNERCDLTKKNVELIPQK